MDATTLAEAALLGVLDGLTEFLPVSSAAHVAVAAGFLGLSGEPLRTLECALQLGAVLAAIGVCIRRSGLAPLKGEHRSGTRRMVACVATAALPALLLGLLARRALQGYFINGSMMATLLFAGGIFMLMAEARYRVAPRVRALRDLSQAEALKIGVVQCIGVALIGIGRPEACVVIGLLLGLSRRAALEFSVLLAIPTLLVACSIGLVSGYDLLAANDLAPVFVGAACAFGCAWASLEWALKFVDEESYVPFAWYRFGLGFVLLATLISGIVKWSDA